MLFLNNIIGEDGFVSTFSFLEKTKLSTTVRKKSEAIKFNFIIILVLMIPIF